MLHKKNDRLGAQSQIRQQKGNSETNKASRHANGRKDKQKHVDRRTDYYCVYLIANISHFSSTESIYKYWLFNNFEAHTSHFFQLYPSWTNIHIFFSRWGFSHGFSHRDIFVLNFLQEKEPTLLFHLPLSITAHTQHTQLMQEINDLNVQRSLITGPTFGVQPFILQESSISINTRLKMLQSHFVVFAKANVSWKCLPNTRPPLLQLLI